MEGFRHAFSEEIPLSALIEEIPTSVFESLVPNVIFHGSQEHGTTQILEHLIRFPLPQTEKVSVEVHLRPKELYANGIDRIEVLDENQIQVTDLSFPIEEKSSMDELYRDLFSQVTRLAQSREKKTSPTSFTFRVSLYHPNSPVLNLVFFPLECKLRVGRHLEDQIQPFFCFVVSSIAPFRKAAVNEFFIQRRKDVSTI